MPENASLSTTTDHDERRPTTARTGGRRSRSWRSSPSWPSLAAVFGGGLLSRTATTSDGDFAGETVEVVIPLAEGGGTDTWARFVGPGPDPRASRPAGLRAGQRRRW